MANATKPVAKLDPVAEVKKMLKSLNATKKADGTFVISDTAFKKIGDLPQDVEMVHSKTNEAMYCFKVGDERIVFEVTETKSKEKKTMAKKETAAKEPATKTTTKAPAKKSPAKASSKAEKAPAKKETTKPATKQEKPVKKASGTSGRTMAPHTSKGRTEGYVIHFKETGKKEQKITNISTCTEIKEWLKSISRKTTEYLRIYDNAGKECRKSAWIEK